MLIKNISKKINFILSFLFIMTAFQIKCQEIVGVEFDIDKMLSEIASRMEIGVKTDVIADSNAMFDLSKKLWVENLKMQSITCDQYNTLKNFSSSDSANSSILNDAESILKSKYFWISIQNIKFIPAIFGFLILKDKNHDRFAVAISILPAGYKNLTGKKIDLIKILDSYKNPQVNLNYSILAKMLKITYQDLIEILDTFDSHTFQQLKRVFKLYNDGDYDNGNDKCCVIM